MLASIKMLVLMALVVVTLLAQRGRACGITAVAVVVTFLAARREHRWR